MVLLRFHKLITGAMRRSLTRKLTVAVLAVLAVASSTDAMGPTDELKGKIFFIRENLESGTQEPRRARYIGVMNADGTEVRTLAPDMDRVLDLIWYGKIRELGVTNLGAETASSGSFTIKIGGSRISELVVAQMRRVDFQTNARGYVGRATFSTNGAKVVGLVHVPDRGAGENKARVCIRSSDGTQSRCSETVEGCPGSSPVWSPDDTMIVFSGRLNEDATSCNLAELFIVDTKSMIGRQLTDVPGSRLSASDKTTIVKRGTSLDYHHKSTHPAWSPDGHWIAFMADAGIYRVRPDGSDLRLIIPGGAFPAWSPDGTRLAFVKGSRDLLSIMRGEKADRIFVASVDGSSQTEIPLTVQRKALYRDLNWAD